MIVYDLNSGHREYPGYDEIEDRRGGGRGRSRRSDGTYMGYGGGIYDHYGMHEKMKEMEERENELEERERRLEERERRHENGGPGIPEDGLRILPDRLLWRRQILR